MGEAARRLVVAITGATGVIYGVRLLETLRDTPVETHLVMSEWARRTIIAETDRHAGLPVTGGITFGVDGGDRAKLARGWERQLAALRA